MSFTNPDYDNLPERVQAVLDATDRPCCSQCRVDQEDGRRMLRCSRCQVAHYCSRSCQMDHFEFHKRSCKSIAKQRQSLEETMGDLSSDDTITLALAQAAVKAMRLGDALVAAGYRETDTIVHGSFYYRRALHYYLQVLKLVKRSFFNDSSPMEDQVLMLLTVLGGNSKVLLEWCSKTGSPRFQNFMPPMEDDSPPEFKTQGLAGNDFLFQALCLLNSMRSLAEYRQSLQAFEAYKNQIQELVGALKRFRPLCDANSLILSFLLGNKQEGKLHMDILPDEIRVLISAIRYHGNGSFLRHLRDDIPLTPQHAPKLLREGGPVGPTLPEFWYIFQDCFFLTPGLNDILNEFVPEEEDDE